MTSDNGSDPPAQRVALVTGASSGIGFAIAAMLADEGYDLMLSSRTAAKLEGAAATVREAGTRVETIAANLAHAEEVTRVVETHREVYGRVDLLANNAGVGVGGPIDDFPSKYMDLMLAVNVRAPMLFYREALDMLRAAGAEHRNALVVNTSSLAGKEAHPHLGVYSATKHAIVGFTNAMNRELSLSGIKSCALCPGLVDTKLADYMKDRVPAHEMIRATDVAESVRTLLRLSPSCIVPEVLFLRPGSDPVLSN